MSSKPALAIAACAFLFGCGGTERPMTHTPEPSPSSPWTEDAARGVEDPRLARLVLAQWEHTMERYPGWASQLGDHRYDDRLEDLSRDAILAQRAARDSFLREARAIDPSTLSDADRVTHALFVDQLESDAATDVCEHAEWNLSAMHNPLTIYNRLPELVELETAADGDHLLARYRAVPSRIDATIANLARGAADGRFTNATTARRVLEMLRHQVEQPIDEWVMLSPREEPREGWSAAERAAFDAAIERAVIEHVRPAYARLADFIETQILPRARDDAHAGLGALPNGAACYAASIREHTTRPESAESVHARGLAEIARIDREIRELGARIFETDDLATILARLRGDETLFFDTEDEVEAAAQAALDAARARMGDYFGVLPQAACVVVRVPDYEAPYTTIAYYRPPHPDGSKPGEYFINTTEPRTRPRFEMQVLAYHEAIPGHHLQIAIGQELDAVPAFRRNSYLTAYAEGWALYTEHLAEEMGLYGGDLDRMGMLSYDAWRAARLVVDTGLHAMGWTREQAEAYMHEHTALSANNIANEVDRYLSWPGQALAYKTGQMELMRLRRHAEEELGERFDLRAFHDAVLTVGAVTLPILEDHVERWIETRRSAP